MSDQSGELLQSAKSGNVQALARLLTRLEREGTSCFAKFPELLAPAHLAYRIGITGPPGAGKSTMIGRLIKEFRKEGKRVAVLAVDPSSPFSKGALLGDRIRYSDHFNDPGVFIRSLGSRGSLGGLSASAYLMVRAFDVANFDIVLIETVGVGQTELEIMNVADLVTVVLVPESGDSIQGMKAGLLEIADVFIVNKGDRPGADSFAHELQSSLMLDPRGPSKHVDVLLTTATTGAGIDVYLSRVAEHMKQNSWRERRVSIERLRSEAKALLTLEAVRAVEAQTEKLETLTDFASAFQTRS